MIEVRERITDRVSWARLRLEATRAARPGLIVAAGVLLGIGCLVFIVQNVNKTLLQNTYEVRLAVDDATGVVPGRDEVRFRGIPAGTITSVDMRNGQAVLTATIQSKYGRIYRDARAVLRPNTALQDMYLDIIDRGTRAAGVASSKVTLPATQTQSSVNIADVLDVFHAGVRARLRSLLDNLGNGLKGRGDALRTAFVELVPLLRVVGRMSEQLAARGAITRRLVHNLAALDGELARRDRELRVLVGAGSATLQTLQSGSQDLNATLRELPPTLTAIDSGFTAVRGILGNVNGAITSLQPLAVQLPGSLTALQRLSATADPALQALRQPVGRLIPLADALVPLSSNLDTAFSALRPQAPTFDHVTKDLAACGRPIQGFFEWDASLLKFADFRGGIARGNAEYNLTSTGLASDPHARFYPVCTPGTALGARPPAPGDDH